MSDLLWDSHHSPRGDVYMTLCGLSAGAWAFTSRCLPFLACCHVIHVRQLGYERGKVMLHFRNEMLLQTRYNDRAAAYYDYSLYCYIQMPLCGAFRGGRKTSIWGSEPLNGVSHLSSHAVTWRFCTFPCRFLLPPVLKPSFLQTTRRNGIRYTRAQVVVVPGMAFRTRDLPKPAVVPPPSH